MSADPRHPSEHPPPPPAPVVSSGPAALAAPALVIPEEHAVDLDERAVPQEAAQKGRHRIVRELGQGAAGLVLEAKDIELRRRVAFKQLHTEAQANNYILSHFLSEAQITAQLDHPNIVPIYTIERGEDGAHYYTMKMVEGKTLRDLVSECRSAHKAGLPLDEAHSLTTRLEIFLKVCDAVAYAHNKKVIHRDLKPENIMIGHFNQVYVMDWGIARRIGRRERRVTDPVDKKDNIDLAEPDDPEAGAPRTQVGALVGSIAYMSPEQARGASDDLDARSDQYALGVILFELCTIKRAVTGKTLYETLSKVVQAQVEPFIHFDEKSKVAPELQAIVSKATSARPDDRYPSVSELAEDVRRFLRGESISALPETRTQRAFRWINRHREVTLAAGSLFLLVVLVLVLGTSLWSLRSQRAAAEARRAAAEERRHSLENARAREQRMSRFLTGVSEGRNRLDDHFYHVEAVLASLAASATQAITSGRPSKVRYYLNQDFEKEGRAPPDFEMSEHYHRKVSLDWPVLKLAPGTTPKKVKNLLKQLAPLRTEFKELFLRSSGQPAPTDPLKVRELLSKTGVPIIWAFVGLEQGVMFAYPGKSGYPPEFDPRKRPWYALGAGKRGIAWGNPYVDALGAGLLLPSAMSLYGSQGQLLGVAGVDCTFDYIIDHLMALPAIPAVRQTFLVDSEGRVVVSSERKGERFAAGQLRGALTLPVLPFPDVVKAIRAGESGTIELTHEGRPTLLGHYRLHSLGWYLVVLADPQALI